MSTDKAEKDIFGRSVAGMPERLHRKTVGIAGCGGLGSQVAVSLTRAGIGHLILVDPDRVAISDLNRQHYFLSDIGEQKVIALAEHLRAIQPTIWLDTHFEEITPDKVARLFGPAALLIEAFDDAVSKGWLIESWCRAFPDRPIVCGSGVAGYGNTSALHVRGSGNIYVCGDEESDLSAGLCSARVAIVANMQANVAVELLMAPDLHGGLDDHDQ